MGADRLSSSGAVTRRRLTARSHSLGALIRTASQVQELQVVDGPDWIESDAFDIIATYSHNEIGASGSAPGGMQAGLPPTIPVPTRQPQTGAPFDRLTPALYQARLALDRKLIASIPPAVTREIVAESGSGDYTMLSRLSTARKTTPDLLGDMPLIVLSRGREASPDQHAAHAELSRMSRNSRHLIVPDAYHEIHLSHPDVVVKAVADVVTAVRGKAPLR